jgi:anti-sigma B factor antagonist
VYVEDALRVPLLTRALRKRIRTLLQGGERAIVLDLARVSRIDAAGVGELVRAYNMTTTANGVLRVVHATRWVREILQRVGLFELLSGSSPPVARSAR